MLVRLHGFIDVAAPLVIFYCKVFVALTGIIEAYLKKGSYALNYFLFNESISILFIANNIYYVSWE